MYPHNGTTRRIALFLLLAGLPNLALAKVLFDFNAKETFYDFKNSESELATTLADDTALPASKSLKVEYKFAGAQSFAGVGVEFRHLAPWMGKWDAFGTGGGLTFLAKSKEPTSMTVQVIVEGKQTYAGKIDVTKDWTRSWLPFADCKNKQGVSFDPATMKVEKLELRPSRKPPENTIWIDEITLEEKVDAAKQEKVIPRVE